MDLFLVCTIGPHSFPLGKPGERYLCAGGVFFPGAEAEAERELEAWTAADRSCRYALVSNLAEVNVTLGVGAVLTIEQQAAVARARHSAEVL